MSENFCAGCSRLRVTADGSLKVCNYCCYYYKSTDYSDASQKSYRGSDVSVVLLTRIGCVILCFFVCVLSLGCSC